MYHLSNVKKVCEIIYGKEISDRTWRRWKNRLGFDEYTRLVTQSKVEQLITMANLKREKPLHKFDLDAVLNSKDEVLQSLNREVKAVPPASCMGRELPQVIKDVTGKSVTSKTLYRWANQFNLEFRLNNNYQKDEIDKWLSVAYEF